VVSLISNTKTRKGLKIQAGLDTRAYLTCAKFTDEQMAELRIEPAAFHGEWNYTIKPRVRPNR
jgi:hypothetical protein